MSSIFDDYERKLSPVNQRQNNLGCMSTFFLEGFRTAPEYELVKVTVSDEQDPNTYDSWIYSNSSYKNVVGDKTILFPPGTSTSIFFTGQYIRPQRQGGTFLITSSDDQYDEKLKGIIRRCTETLRWYDDDGVLRQYPVAKLKNESVGVTEGAEMDMPIGTYRMGIPQDDVTFKLQEDRQFILNRKHKYRITGFEDVGSSTYMVIKLEKDEENHSIDDFENGIANFEDRPRFSISVEPTSIQLSVGNSVSIEHTLLDKDGNESEKPISFISSDESILTVDENGLVSAIALGNAVITVRMTNNEDVSSDVSVSVVDVPVDNIVYSTAPNIESLLARRSSDIEISRLNNGVVESETYTIEVDSSTTLNADSYSFEVLGSSSFRIENIESDGNLIIKITPDSNPLEAFTKTYRLEDRWF